MAITGIKSVDFYLTATGEGVVNHNGSFLSGTLLRAKL